MENNKKSCLNCQHYNFEPSRFDQPYPEIWCSKGHWCGVSSEEEHNALGKYFDCNDFEKQTK